MSLTGSQSNRRARSGRSDDKSAGLISDKIGESMPAQVLEDEACTGQMTKEESTESPRGCHLSTTTSAQAVRVESGSVKGSEQLERSAAPNCFQGRQTEACPDTNLDPVADQKETKQDHPPRLLRMMVHGIHGMDTPVQAIQSVEVRKMVGCYA